MRERDRLSRMSPSLDSAILKWNRAVEHLNALKHECGVFMSTNPYGISPDLEIEGDWQIGKLLVREHPPIRLGVIAGDVINNVNAALDHLIYALSTTQPRGTGFPVYIDPDAYVLTSPKKKRSDRERLLSGVPDPDRAIIDAFQPYEGDLLKSDPLWLMREFANADKHRVTQPAFMKPRNLRFSYSAGCEFEAIPVSIKGPLDDGAELFRMQITCPDSTNPHVQVKAEVDLSIAFGPTRVDLVEMEAIMWRAADVIGCF